MGNLISYFMYCCVRLLHSTYRYRFAGNEHLISLSAKKQNYIYAIFHQNLFPGILAQYGLPHIVIISKSKDAAPVAFTCKRFGHLVVRGSSRKGEVDKNGSLAKSEMIEKLKLGHPGAVTVDGPKGPPLKAKPGIIDMAKKSQAMIIPYTVCSNSYWQFNSWDLFRVPKPFAKVLVAYGAPISIPVTITDFTDQQKNLESLMNELSVYAQLCLLKWDQFSSQNWHQLRDSE